MNNPSEIAREALRQLALQRIPPTPDNYRTHYFQIAGVKDGVSDIDPVTILKEIVGALPTTNEIQKQRAEQCASALDKKQWSTVTRMLVQTIGQEREEPAPWVKLIPALLQHWETKQTGITSAQKKLALDRALTGAPDKLYLRLSHLITQWSSKSATAPTDELQHPEMTEPTEKNPNELNTFVLQDLVAPLLTGDPALQKEALSVAQQARAAKTIDDHTNLLAALKRIAFRIEGFIEDQTELRGGLLMLIQLVIDNIGELAIDDAWLQGQMEVLRTIVNQPLSLRNIDAAERRLKDILVKQSHLKLGLADAQASLKSLLADFVIHLGSFSASTGAYHDKIGGYAEKISSAKSIRELEDVISAVMTETRAIQLTAQRTRDELELSRVQVEEAQRRASSLEMELARTSELIRLDQLTGALNRRGLEEVFDKEINRAQRRKTPLCLAVIDIDNFKKLNDSMGHQTGDAALVHLVESVRDTLRPQDSIARFGGEEFVILLPETALNDAQQAIIRVQRALTKKIFLRGNQKVLITFSAGVTQLAPEETRESAIKRADELMYQAKNTGKNKVVAG